MKRISLVTLLFTILLLVTQSAPERLAVISTPTTQITDGGTCFPTGATSCFPGASSEHWTTLNGVKGSAHRGDWERLADGTQCIPTGPTSCFPKSTSPTSPAMRRRAAQEVADGGQCIPTCLTCCPRKAGEQS